MRLLPLPQLRYSELYVGPLSEEPGGTLAPEPAQIGLAHNAWNKFGKEQSALVATPQRADHTQIQSEYCFIC
jgi:hypothetical protein